MKAILTVVGKDQVGIVYQVAKICSESTINIRDINQTLMEEYFTMVVLLDLEKTPYSLREIQDKFDLLGEEMGLTIKLQNEEIFNSIYNI